jgi:hypothetical protein
VTRQMKEYVETESRKIRVAKTLEQELDTARVGLFGSTPVLKVRDKSERRIAACTLDVPKIDALMAELTELRARLVAIDELPPDTKRSRELCGADSVLRGAE